MAYTLNPVPKQGDTRLVALKKILFKMQSSGTVYPSNNPRQADTYRWTLRKIIKSTAGLP